MLPGVRKVQFHGVHDEQVFLKFSATRLAQFGITAGDIVNTLVEQNIVLPGGRVDSAEQSVIVHPTGNFRSVQDIENVEITIPNTQQTIRLRDEVTVERAYADPPRDLAYFNGEQAVVMVFLGVRTGLIVGSFVPLTMLLGMIIMPFFGIELERVSIASSIIALGMLVDNGIVLVGAVAAIVLGGFIATQMVREFFGPSTDRNQFLVYVDLLTGYRIDSTDDTVQRLTRWLSDKEANPEVTSTIIAAKLKASGDH